MTRSSTSLNHDLTDQQLQATLRAAGREAPQTDLWPRLAAPVSALATTQARQRRRYQFLQRARRLSFTTAGLLLALLLLAGFWQLVRLRSLTIGATGTVPETILLVTPRQTETPPFSSVAVFRAGSRDTQGLLEGAEAPAVSPDGRQLIFVQRLPANTGAGAQLAIVALTSDTLTTQWSTVVAAQPDKQYVSVSVAITADRVYVALGHWQRVEPLTIVALDRITGREQTRWSVALAGRALSAGLLYASPDGKRLHAIVTAADPATKTNMAPEQALFRFRLPDGQEEQRIFPMAKPTAAVFFGPQSRPTPDGRALYQFTYGQNGTALGLAFLNLATGAIEELPEPLLHSANPNDYLVPERALSSDGRRLYVLGPTLGKLVVFNLAERRIEQTITLSTEQAAAPRTTSLRERLWHALGRLFVQETSAKIAFSGDMQLSPDGRRLYAIGATGRGYEARPTGVLVIDLASSRVSDRWLPNMAPNKLILSNDGRYLHVQGDDTGRGSYGVGVLRTLDTTTGVEVFSTDRQVGAAYSLAGLYQERYGKHPGIATTSAHDQTNLTPAAALTATVSATTITTGDQVTIEARFTDPRNGQTVQLGQPGLRYEPPTQVTAKLCRRTDPTAYCDDVSVTLAEAGYGVYRGNAALPSAGNWSAEITVAWPNNLSRWAVLRNAVTVQQAFAGSDGRRYIMTFTSDPARPAVRQPVAVRAAFAAAGSRAPLPDGVAIAGGLPPEIEATYYAQGGVTTRKLRQTSHGVYEGEVTLWSPELWTVHMTIPGMDGKRLTFAVGAIAVAER